MSRIGVALVCLSMLAAAPGAVAGGPLETALFDMDTITGPESELAMKRIAASGATVVRVNVAWYDVAPRTRPPTFDPADPQDPSYDWSRPDTLVMLAVSHALKPLVSISGAPLWAQPAGGAENPPLRPNPVQYGLFAKAAALRYGGTIANLPRVRYWAAWNEPNLSIYLRPQLVNRQPVSPTIYRNLLNRFASAVHAVHADNVVVAGGLAPFRDITPSVLAQNRAWGPMSFMRELLCLSKSLRPTCRFRSAFDVWAMHPYTSGGPTHKAVLPDDVSLGDLEKVRRALDAAARARHIDSRQPVRFWVTEFSWDSRPPDKKGVPTWLHTRWVAEALYRMWQNGVGLVTWFLMRDQPVATSYFQSGLFYRGKTLANDRPKPALRAFRFPLVAFAENGRVRVWGRTPAGKPGNVVVEQSFRGGWKRLALLRADRYGIFQRLFRSGTTGHVRARLADGTDHAVPFSLKRVPDRVYYPFGNVDLEPR